MPPRPDPDLVFPTVDLAGEPPDYEVVAQAWEAVRLAVARAQAMETLQEEHGVLQRAYHAEHRRAEELQARVDEMVQFATVRIPKIQAWVGRLVRERDLNRLVIAEFRDEMGKRQDIFHEVQQSRLKIRYWKGQYEKAVLEYEVEIAKLEAKLDAANTTQVLEQQIIKLKQDPAQSEERVKKLVGERDQLQKMLTVARSRSPAPAPPVPSSGPRSRSPESSHKRRTKRSPKPSAKTTSTERPSSFGKSKVRRTLKRSRSPTAGALTHSKKKKSRGTRVPSPRAGNSSSDESVLAKSRSSRRRSGTAIVAEESGPEEIDLTRKSSSSPSPPAKRASPPESRAA
ncbi:unnamed protein product [Peronospora destructor]|uniref:Uncharacterized protein n=1 Tax=Peronospora destructor TaxID=86335 RepID=A0AAV0TMA1_9STRA|nr:unnamed protein product [Peronospora destructor]